ncbi:hypothetical protein IFR05_007524 [Cadophora sp. M221]|nr:hypothetical protein IFR05_007524 [Cadophora sp. M221]
MAILKDGNDKYEVRIKRYPDRTYFDEHIRVEDRYAGKTTKDMTTQLEFANLVIDGQKILEARLAFLGLGVDENLDKATDVMGINPESLGYFRVVVFKTKRIITKLTDEEYAAKLTADDAAAAERKEARKNPFRNDREEPKEQKNLWDAKKVDEESFSKDGITCAVGFVGGRTENEWQPDSPPTKAAAKPGSIFDPRIIAKWADRTSKLVFSFLYRSSDFIERTGIVPYPPPLHLYGWDVLTESERKIVLKELQAINKVHVHQALEAKNGAVVEKCGKGRKADEPKEWRAWTKMYRWEREATFNVLKKSKRAHERGEVQHQFKNNRGEIISLIDDEPDQDDQSKSNKRALAVIEGDDFDDDFSVSGIKNEVQPIIEKAATLAVNDSEDDELRRDEEKARYLAEEIETEERLARLKRERRALDGKIEVARKKKSRRN